MRLPRPATLLKSVWFVSLAAGALLIGAGSLIYFDAFAGDELAPFVVEHLPLPMEELWTNALKVHVVAALFSLPACLFLSLSFMLRFPRVHRWLGRTTGVVVLFALAPSGFYLSLFAKGGLPSTIGFALSGLIVVVAMVMGVKTARAKDYVAHRRFTMHVLGQLAVAVVSRAMMFALDAGGFDPERAYIFSLWLPVLGSVALVELLVSRRTHRRKHHEAVSRPDLGPRGQPGLSHAV